MASAKTRAEALHQSLSASSLGLGGASRRIHSALSFLGSRRWTSKMAGGVPPEKRKEHKSAPEYVSIIWGCMGVGKNREFGVKNNGRACWVAPRSKENGWRTLRFVLPLFVCLHDQKNKKKK